jgi:8-oxo-dGTP pyrophosphatase MutT (NUDIX family)
MPGAARPKDAASLVLLRAGPCGTEVLMGRRGARHRFLPHHYVFPGGRVDRADHRVLPLAPLPPEVEKRLMACCTGARARALAVAAVRETWEETGLMLGELERGTLRPALDRLDYVLRAITPSESPIRFHARFFLADAASAGGGLGGSGELLDLAWRPLAESLKLPIADVTEFVLREIVGSPARPNGGDVPVFCFRGGRAMVRY